MRVDCRRRGGCTSDESKNDVEFLTPGELAGMPGVLVRNTVRMRPLDDLVAGQTFDLIRLDVGGSEMAALKVRMPRTRNML